MEASETETGDALRRYEPLSSKPSRLSVEMTLDSRWSLVICPCCVGPEPGVGVVPDLSDRGDLRPLEAPELARTRDRSFSSPSYPRIVKLELFATGGGGRIMLVASNTLCGIAATSRGDWELGGRSDALGVFSREESSIVVVMLRVSKEGEREEYGE